MKFVSACLAAGAIVAGTALAQAPADYESGVLLNTTDLLPAELLRGASHRVRDQVATDGFLAHFEIDSDFGTFTAVGVPEARRTIAEFDAIRRLVATSKSDLFAEGLRRSIEQPIDAVKNIITHPVESVKQAPKTVGHFFNKVGSAIGRGADKIAGSTSGDGPKPSAGEVGSATAETAKNIAGFDKAKLDTARQLGVDPYSDNARLHSEIEKVTWAFFAGGLPLRIGAIVVSGGASTALTATKAVGIPEDMYAMTRSEIALRDETSLQAMQVPVGDISKFQIHPALSTTRRHRIVTLLEDLPLATGKPAIIGLANACETPAQAEFLINALAILANHQISGAADYVALKVVGRLPGAETRTGEIHVPAPVDHVTWTPEAAAFARRDDLGQQPKVLVHTGNLSPATTAGLAANGWKTISVGYPTR